MQLQDCINFQLSKIQNAVFTYFKSCLSPFDVTPSQYALLSCLWERGEQTPTQLAQTLSLDTSSMTGLLTRMESKGLVSREYSVEDRRTVIIHLTELGVSLRPGITKTIEEANQVVLRGVSQEDAAAFRRCTAVFLENVQAEQG